MKLIQKSNSQLYRLIALVMAAVMVLTLVAIDTRFHLFAADEEAKTEAESVDITDLLNGDIEESKLNVYYNTDKTEISLSYTEDNLEGSNVVVGKTSEKETYMYKDVSDEKEINTNNIASSSDAPTGLNSIFKMEPYTVEDQSSKILAVYAPSELNTEGHVVEYKYVGIVSVVYDGDKPSISEDNGIALEGGKSISTDDGFIIAKGSTAAMTVTASDDISGIASVKYKKDGGKEEKADKQADGTYKIPSVSGSGKYEITACDLADNQSEPRTVVIREAAGITVESVKMIESGKTTEYTQGGVTIMGTQTTAEIVVSATEVAGNAETGTKLMSLTLSYSFIDRNNTISLSGEKKFENGNATIQIPASVMGSLKDTSGTLTMYVCDDLGRQSYAFDQKGYLVFVDGTAPEVSISNISAGDSEAVDKETYEALPDNDKWSQCVTADVTATEDNSYVTGMSYSLDGAAYTSLTDGTDSYELTEQIRIGRADTDSVVCAADGKHTVSIKAGNYVGGESEPVTLDAWIDTTAPSITFADTSYTVTDVKEQTIPVEVSDELAGVSTVTASIWNDNDSSAPVKSGITVSLSDGKGEIPLDSVTESGHYTVSVDTVDYAGNKSAESVKVYVNITEVQLKTAELVCGSSSYDLTDGQIYYTNGDTSDDNKLKLRVELEGYELSESAENVNIQIICTPFAGGERRTVAVLNTAAAKVTGDGTETLTFEQEIQGKADEGKYTVSVDAVRNGTDTKDIDGKEYNFAYDVTAPGTIGLSVRNDADGEAAATEGGISYCSKYPVIVVTSSDNSDKYTVKYNVTGSSGAEAESGKWDIDSVGTSTRNLTISGSRYDTDKVYTVKVSAEDAAGNNTVGSISAQFLVDTTAPDVTEAVVKNTEGQIKEYCSTDANVTFTSGDNVYIDRIVVTGTRDGKAIAQNVYSSGSISKALSQTQTYTTPGRYKLVMTAYDKAGNKSSGTVAFAIDKEKPVISVDDTQDPGLMQQSKELTIYVDDDYVEDMIINDVTVTVYYETFDGSRKGSEPLPVTYTLSANRFTSEVSLSEKYGQAVKYYIEVTVADRSGNMSSLNTRTAYGDYYYIDSTSPAVTIDPKPDANSGYYKSGVSLGVNVTEQFGCTKGYSHTLTIENTGTGDKKVRRFSSAKSSFYSEVSKGNGNLYTQEGAYNLLITATDSVGNVTTKRVKFHIDKTKPTVTLGSYKTLNNTAVTLPVELSDNMKGKSYTVHVVRRNSSGKVVYDGDMEKGTWSNDYGTELEFIDEGDYTVTVKAVDKAGNKSNTAKAEFRIDKTAPAISISGVSDTQTSGCTATISVDEAFSFDYNGSSLAADGLSVTITRKTDGSAETSVATIGTSSFSSGNPHTATYSFAEDGEYTITANARDLSGNTAASAVKTFKIDQAAPVIKAAAVDRDSKAVNNYGAVGSVDAAEPNYVDMSINVEETFFATNNVKIAVTKDGKDISSACFANYSNSADVSSGTQRFSEDGVYSVKVTAQDALGNTADDYSLVFTVDNTAPVIAATDVLKGFMAKDNGDDGSVLLNADDFADILADGYEALWNVSDTSVFSVDAKMDGIDLIDFSDMTDGYHKIELSVTDEVGHTSSGEFEFTYDGTAPRIIITGVDDGDTVKDPFIMTISLEDEADEITSIVINGNVIDPANYQEDNKYEMNIEEYDTYTIEVTAADKAGNITSTVDADGHVFTFKLSKGISVLAVIIIVAACVLVIALIIFIILAGRKKKKKAA